MDLPVWIMLAAVLLVAVQADPKDQGPQVFNENKSPPKEQQKRQQKYEMKEVIMYLTPSQIRSLESGQSVIEVHQSPPPPAQPNHSQLNKQIKEQIVNALNEGGQILQKNVENLETNRKQRIQVIEAIQNTPSKEKEQNKLVPENNVPPSSQVEIQKREKFELPLELQLLPNLIHHSEQLLQKPSQLDQLQLQHQISPTPVPYLQEPNIPSVEAPLEHIRLSQERPQWRPQNYAYLYFYPKGKPVNTGTSPDFHPDLQTDGIKELLLQPEQHKNLHPNFQLIPYEYGLQSKLEAQQILKAQLENHHLDAERLKLNILQAHQFENIDIQQINSQKQLESQYHHQEALQLEASQQLAASNQLQAHQLEAAQIEVQEIPARYEPQKLEAQQIQTGYESQQLQAGYEPQEQEAAYRAHKLEAQQLQAAYEAQQFQTGHEAQKQEAQQLEAAFEAQQLQAQKLEAQQLQDGYKIQQFQTGYEAQKLDTQQLQVPYEESGYKTQQLESEYEAQQLRDQEHNARYEAQQRQANYEAQKLKALHLPSRHDAQQLKAEYDAHKLEAQQLSVGHEHKLEAENIQAEYEAQQKAKQLDLQAVQRHQMKEIIEAHKLKEKLQAQEKEAHRLDTQLEAEQLKAEDMRQEQQRLEFLRKLEPKRTEMHSILKPLFQGHNIGEQLSQQIANFPHHNIYLEKGFKPLQYAPQYNGKKYAREVEKIIQKNFLEKQKAIAKAEAISNEPSVFVKKEIIKHVSVPTPVFVPIPEPIAVKVPQPYPVPLEIIRPIPVPIVKMEKVEVEKPVPVEVEKLVPVPVTKNVYVNVNKPYVVKKVVPIEVKKEIPVPVRTQKFSLIRHVWDR
ncbi:probable basic-leucine zipper transcription factor I [Pectinophora gossypiella]|uniref:probable basic-leucine zipper transcription factor I n=1 Tax=Pectinophora gossypiella TaxID=13191 RepID=UPI00214E084D|nr:probable basic-leucine zipper transcription factor I [Pectinophora gossypiella]